MYGVTRPGNMFMSPEKEIRVLLILLPTARIFPSKLPAINCDKLLHSIRDRKSTRAADHDTTLSEAGKR